MKKLTKEDVIRFKAARSLLPSNYTEEQLKGVYSIVLDDTELYKIKTYVQDMRGVRGVFTMNLDRAAAVLVEWNLSYLTCKCDYASPPSVLQRERTQLALWYEIRQFLHDYQ